MRTVTLSVSDQLAKRLANMSQKDLDKILSMLQKALDDTRSLEEIIRDAQEQAEKNGLTQEKLDQILRKSE